MKNIRRYFPAQQKPTTMKNLLSFVILLITTGAYAQNDSILPNLYGEYAIQYDNLELEYSSEWTVKFLNPHPGEDTLLVVASFDTVARIALDGDKAYIKRTPAGQSYFFFYDWHFGNDWEILYDFSLQVGDSACRYYGGTILYVTDIDTVYVQGEPRKVLVLNDGEDKWVQGIGSLWHPFAPKFYYVYNANATTLCGAVLNYSGPSPVDSDYYSDTSCVITEVREIYGMTGIRVYPNPAREFFWLKASGVQNAEATIHDLSGRVVYRGVLYDETTRIPTAGLSPGMYLVYVQDERGTAVRKIVVN